MKIIKNNKKVFACIIILSALIAIIPTSLIYIFSQMSIGIEEQDSPKVIEEKIDVYFNDGGFEKDIENALRKYNIKPHEIKSAYIYKRSIDARNKKDIYYFYCDYGKQSKEISTRLNSFGYNTFYVKEGYLDFKNIYK